MYVVSGATGQTGSVVAKTLLGKGLPVRVIVRSKEKGKAFKDLGAEVAIADVMDAGALSKALEGAKALYLMKPPEYQSEDMLDETQKIVDAFKAAIENSQLEKIVVLSSVGAHLQEGSGVVFTLHMIEEALKDLDIPITFLRPPSFMENWNLSLDAVTNEGILPSTHLPLDAKFSQISVEDIGRAAAEALTENTQGVEIKELAGFPYSTNDVAEAFSKVLGKEIKAVAVPEEQWMAVFETFCSKRNAELMYEMTLGINEGLLDFEFENQIEGKVTINDYARKVLGSSQAAQSN